MKKALLVLGLLFFISLPASAQEYWNLKTALSGIAVFPADSNGMAFGGGARVSFGEPDGSFDIGFEASKWWRSFDLFDPLADSLILEGSISDTDYDSQLDREQQALQFSVFTRYRFMRLFSEGMNVYSGIGGGFYFLQERREEARQNPITGIWEIVMVDNYLDTKAQSFVSLGFDGNLFGKFDMYLENRFTYVFDWDRWDNPYAYSLGLGLKYVF